MTTMTKSAKTSEIISLNASIEALINSGFDLKSIQTVLTAKKPKPKPLEAHTTAKRVWGRSILERTLGLNKAYEFIVKDIADFGISCLTETLSADAIKTFNESQVLELCKARSLKKFLKFGTPSQIAKAITPMGAISIFQKAAIMDAAKFQKVLAS